MTTIDRRSSTRPPLPILTSLRFFAAAEVLLYHLGRMTDVDVVEHYLDVTRFPGNVVNVATSAGHEAVTFFFVLSGFILTYVYAGESERQGFAVRATSFWWARFARLAPAFYLGLLLSAPFLAYGYFLMHSPPLSALVPGLVLTPFFLQTWWPPSAYVWNFPSWSLSVEAFFYALFPLFAVLAARVPRRVLFWGAVAFVLAVAPVRGGLLAAAATAPEPAHTFAIYFPPFSLPQFVMGIALGRLFLFGPRFAPGTYKTMVGLGMLAVIVAFGWHSHLPPALDWLRPESGTAALLFAPIIFGAAGMAGSSRLLASRPLVFLGDASYSMYILHIPVSLWWKSISTKVLHLSLSPFLNFLAMFLVVIVVASLNQAFLEPKLRRWLLRRRP